MRFRARGGLITKWSTWGQPPLRQAQGRLSAVRRGEARRALSATIDEAKTRRAARLDSRPYVGFAFSCKLTLDETSPLSVRGIAVACFDPHRIRICLQCPPQARRHHRD